MGLAHAAHNSPIRLIDRPLLASRCGRQRMLARTSRSIPSTREIQRERERRARQRRANRLVQMRATHKSLQAAVLAVHTLDEHVWERFLNTEASRMRNFLKASLRLREEEKRLRHEHDVLHQQLTEHRVSAQVLAHIVRNRDTMDQWEWKLDRLRALRRHHFTPWTMQECQEVMDEALKALNGFKWSPAKQSSGLSFLGWRESRRVDPMRNLLQFQFCKTFRGYDVMDYVNTLWDTFTDARTFQKLMLGPRIIGTLEILQQLGPNTVIVHVSDRIESIMSDVQVVYLVHRTRTERGFTQCVRSICCPDLMKAIESVWANDLWPSNHFWFQWKLLDTDEQGYKLRVGGSMGYTSVHYANKWMEETFGAVLRTEQTALRRQLITSNSR